MNTEKLDALMQIKKKSDASKTQKNEYVDLMVELLKENGYSDETEKYLFMTDFAELLPFSQGECLRELKSAPFREPTV